MNLNISTRLLLGFGLLVALMALMVGLMKFSIFFFYTYSLLVGSIFIEK